MQRTFIAKTWKSIKEVAIQATMDFLGWPNVEVKMLSSKSFLITFPEDVDVQEIDMEFVGLGFLEIRPVDVNNLTLPQRLWLKIRVLPLVAWSYNNF